MMHRWLRARRKPDVRFRPSCRRLQSRYLCGMDQQDRYSGLTLNERLYDAGLMTAFDAARRDNDRVALIRLCHKVYVSDPEWTVDKLLATQPESGR